MNWQYKIALNNVLQRLGEKHDLSQVEDACPDEVKQAIACELEKARPLVQFADRIRDCISIAAVNRLFDTIYDTADREGVWCDEHEAA